MTVTELIRNVQDTNALLQQIGLPQPQTQQLLARLVDEGIAALGLVPAPESMSPAAPEKITMAGLLRSGKSVGEVLAEQGWPPSIRFKGRLVNFSSRHIEVMQALYAQGGRATAEQMVGSDTSKKSSAGVLLSHLKRHGLVQFRKTSSHPTYAGARKQNLRSIWSFTPFVA